MARQRKYGSRAPAPDEKKPDDKQAQGALLDQRLNDPEWRPLAEHIRKNLGDQFTLEVDEVLCLGHGTFRRPRFPWPMSYPCTVSKLLAILSRHGPKVGRLLVDDLMGDRREKRNRPTAERNAIWKRWHEEDKLGPTKISQRWWKETHQKASPNTVKQALRRTR